MSYEGIHPAFAELLLELPNGSSVQAPTDGWSVKLYSQLFNESGVSVQLSAASAGYAAAQIASSPLGFNNPAGRVVDNATPILFPINSSVDTPWETAIATAIGKKAGSTSTLPEICFFGKLDTGWSVAPGNRLRYPLNRFKVRMHSTTTAISEEFANNILKILQGAALNPPNSFYVGLGSQIPDSTGDIGEITGLPRIQVPCVAGAWVSGGMVRKRQNANVLEFPEAPANLPKVKSFGLYAEPRAAGATEISKPWWFGKSAAEKIYYEQDMVIILSGGMVVGL
ncbi:MAG: hypothetical protein HC836_49285 [Richelia sp. RM2_1_2]|nr:hypothetical protein [Richelia sp. RM1_1_1]NJO65788.1 hypothetical protein [Richelia sp. RM2_1_2]